MLCSALTAGDHGIIATNTEREKTPTEIVILSRYEKICTGEVDQSNQHGLIVPVQSIAPGISSVVVDSRAEYAVNQR